MVDAHDLHRAGGAGDGAGEDHGGEDHLAHVHAAVAGEVPVGAADLQLIAQPGLVEEEGHADEHRQHDVKAGGGVGVPQPGELGEPGVLRNVVGGAGVGQCAVAQHGAQHAVVREVVGHVVKEDGHHHLVAVELDLQQGRDHGVQRSRQDGEGQRRQDGHGMGGVPQLHGNVGRPDGAQIELPVHAHVEEVHSEGQCHGEPHEPVGDHPADSAADVPADALIDGLEDDEGVIAGEEQEKTREDHGGEDQQQLPQQGLPCRCCPLVLRQPSEKAIDAQALHIAPPSSSILREPVI